MERFTRFILIASLCLAASLLLNSCTDIKSPKPEVFLGENTPPPKQEFRWSNGKAPKTLDPAQAAASPEADIVRAIYEGLTNYDSATSQVSPSVAAKWTSSEDLRIWTFQLRQDAKWTNGEQITAQDFVRSWKRLTELGKKVSQRSLLKNIVGMDTEDVLPVFADGQSDLNLQDDLFEKGINPKTLPEANSNSNISEKPTPVLKNNKTNTASQSPTPRYDNRSKSKGKFGVEAIGKFTLKVSLVHPDPDFPLLVSHPIFRPVYLGGDDSDINEINPDRVTNGAFKIVAAEKDGIVLERNPLYWNQSEIKLDRVKFVPSDSAEQALAAYRSGELDAITNANFEPLALKLLKPFEELHKATHGALNYYEFNLNAKPFDDYRVRQALAISIERVRLTEDEMDGATEPALKFLPFESTNNKLHEDVAKAKKLLEEAGYANGENFPTVRLLVNRNNIQQNIAHSVAKMWLKNLNIKTEVIVKDRDDFENLIETGDFSLARRGIVLPTHDEMINMLAMFDRDQAPIITESKPIASASPTLENKILEEKTGESLLNSGENEKEAAKSENTSPVVTSDPARELIMSQDEALDQLPAIPLYFPNSYSLVKPYIKGFELNAFDALSLKNVEIDNDWQSAKKIATGSPAGQR